MSMGLELVPFAIAFGVIVRRLRQRDGMTELSTPIRDATLLTETSGAQARADGALDAELDGVAISFIPGEDGTFVARVDDASADAAEAALNRLHDDYVRRVQQQIAERVRARANEHDLEFEGQELRPDGTIVMTLRVDDPKTISMEIRPDGKVAAETHGLTGDSCLPYATTLAELVDGEVVDSKYTPDYYVRAPSAQSHPRQTLGQREQPKRLRE
jgi:hypothetical protein